MPGGAAFVRLGAQFGRRAVERISHNRMAERRHVHADLVGASGFDFHFEQRELAIRRIDFSLNQVMT